MLFSMAACGKKGGNADGETTLNIRVYKAGWGDEYVKAWIEAFEQMYEKEGYKINVVSADSNLHGQAVTSEMLLCEDNEIDLYITASVGATVLANLSQDNNVGMIAADLTDVYNSKPIKADGTEEDQTVLEKMKKGHDAYHMYQGEDENYQGKYYTFGYQATPTGLIVNEEVLSSYGLTMPKTTDELLHCYDVIEAKSKESGVHPTSWAGYNGYTYWYMLEDVWVAQYDGIDTYRDFLAMGTPENPEDGWKVYESEGWRKSLDVLAKCLNLDYAPEKTISMDLMEAQHNLLSGKAVFAPNGAWLQNEMAANYLEEAKKVKMIKAPVISALGQKIGLADDATLSQIVGLVDEGKSVDEIVGAVAGVTSEQVQQIVTARGLYYDWGTESQCIINSYSTKVDIAKLFLRFIASDDAAQMLYEKSSSCSVYATADSIKFKEDDSNFVKSVYDIWKSDAANFVYRTELGLRETFGLEFFYARPEVEKVIASAKGKITGDQIMDDEQKYFQDEWAIRMKDYKAQ